jgi:hypothetical protein
MSVVRFPLLALLLLPACSADLDFVRPQRLAVLGAPLAGGTVVSDAPTLQITVRIASDATDFDPTTVLRLLVNGVDRTAEMSIGGDYATLTLDPPPVGTPQAVELFVHDGTTPIDTGTYEATPYTGPVLLGVTPDTAQAGEQVTISGLGFAAGTPRVFFGGAEGTVDSSTDAEITATVPDGAVPGLVFVLIGEDTAVGMVPFLPLDDTGTPVPTSTRTTLFYVAPARGPAETVLTVAGVDLTDEGVLRFNGSNSARVYNVRTINFPLIGDVIVAYGVVPTYWDPGAGDLRLRDDNESNILPFTVE